MSSWQYALISIHAPREGGDGGVVRHGYLGIISIHAPREGGDPSSTSGSQKKFNFNPRPPRGGRRAP